MAPKHPNYPYYTTVKYSSFFSWITLGLLAAGSSQAAAINKADNTSALNLPAAWPGNVVPGPNDVAVWGGNIAGPLTNDLGANTAWSGIKILNPGGPVQINAGYNLTNGTAGIDLSAATQPLTLSNNVIVSVPQYWQVASGQTLSLGGSLTKTLGGDVRFNLPDGTANVLVTNLATGLLLNGTVPFGTVNDTDFAALNGNGQIVAGSSLGIYTANPSGNFKSTTAVVDFSNSSAAGLTVSGNSVVDGLRINQPNSVNSSWTINTGGKVLSLNALLITTNVGSQPVYVTGGGTVRIYNSGLFELLLIQNNPAAPLIFQSGTSIIQNGAAASTLTKVGVGTAEIRSTSGHTGGTRVYEGTLLITGTGNLGGSALTVYGGTFAGTSGAANIAPTVVNGGATNAIRINTANGQFLQATNLTLSAGAHLLFSPTNGVSLSTTTAPLAITNPNTSLYATNAVIVDVAASPAAGQYPLIKYGTLAGNGFAAFSLNIQPHIVAYLSNNLANSSIDLVVTANTQPLQWAAGNGTWDVATTANWKDSVGATTTYQQNGAFGDSAVLGDAASGGASINVTLNNPVTPTSTTVSGTKNYNLIGAGGINGAGAFTKTGTGTLNLATTNTFGGGLNLNGGTTLFNTLNNLGNGAINFGGGTLKYGGNLDDLSTRLVTFNPGGATIDDGGGVITFANPVGNNGTGGLTKLGAGTLTLDGTNQFSGNTIVNAGTLALGTDSFISNSAAILIGNSATLDVSANSPITLQNQILAGTGTVKGGVTLANGSTLSPATNGVAGTLTISSGDLTVQGGSLAWDISATGGDALVVGGNLNLLSGTLALNVIGTLTNGTYRLIQYSGFLPSGAGSSANLSLTGFSQTGKVASLSDATAGEIDLVVKNQSGLTVLWQGGVNNSWDASTLNWLTGSTANLYGDGDQVIFNDTAASPSVSLQGAFFPASVTVSNNVQNYTLADGTGNGGGKISGASSLVKRGTGTLVIDTVDNNYGPTTISGGTLQVGDGSATGDLGAGNITNNATLVFIQTDSRTVAGQISGSGSLTQAGNGTLTLGANNTLSGPTIINSGTLQVGSGGTTGSLGTSQVTNNSALVFDHAGSQTVNNPITGTGTVGFSGPGVTILSGSQTYQGGTAISNGVVKLARAEEIPDATTVPGATGGLYLDGSLDLSGFNETINALSGTTGVVSNSAPGTSTLIIGDTSSTTTFNGLLADGAGGGKLQLVKQGTSTQTLNTYNTYSGGTILSNGIVVGPTVPGGNAGLLGSGPVIFAGGTLQLGGYAGSATVQLGTFANPIIVPTNQTGTILSIARGDVNSVLTGAGTLNFTVTYTRGNVGGDWSGFTGWLNLLSKSGSSDDFRVNSTKGFPQARVYLGPGVNLYNLVAGAIIPIGELSGDPASFLPLGATGTGGAQPAVWRVGLLNTSTNFAGTIADGTGIIKDGTGSWTLTGANTYTGVTAVTNGTLVLANDSAASPNTSAFELRSSGALLDITGLSASTLNLGSSQMLTGSGTVRGNVVAPAGSTLNVGYPTGWLTVTTNLEIGGAVNSTLNRTNAINSSGLAAQTFTIDPTATLTVTNAGPAFQGGEVFHLFNQPVTGFASITLPAIASPLSWNNRIAVDGTIAVLGSLVNTNATSLTSSWSGQVLTLSWPADHTGWRLQAQTNSTGSGLGTNWVDLTGASTTNQIAIPVNARNGAVFFRLVYP